MSDLEKKMKKLNLTELKLKFHELDKEARDLIDKKEEIRTMIKYKEDDKWFVFKLIKEKELKQLPKKVII